MKMQTANLTPFLRQLRMNIRNFLLTATMEELQKELQLSEEMQDTFRIECIRELMSE